MVAFFSPSQFLTKAIPMRKWEMLIRIRYRGSNAHMNRRKIVKSLGLGAVVSLAGCASLQPGGGQDQSGGNGSDGNGSDGPASPSGNNSSKVTPSGNYEVNPGPESDTEYEKVRNITFWSMPRSSQSDLFQVGRLAADHLAELGVTIDFQVKGQSQRVDDVFSGNFDMAQLKWSGLPTNAIPYYNLYASFHSDNLDTTNIPNFQNQEFDQAVDDFKTTYDKQERVKAAKRAQKILSEQVPVDYCVVPQSRVAANTSSFTNWKEQVGGYSYSNVNTFRNLESNGNKNALIYGSEQPLRGFPNFMTLAASPETWILYKLMYDSLVELDLDGNPIGRAAENWNVKNDTTILFTLREGMKWQDGETVTAGDVKFTWDYITNWEIGWLSSDYAPYDSSEIVDERTVQFNLSEPSAIFIPISAYRMPILPKHIWEGIVEEEGFESPTDWNNPDTTGSGPFQLAQYESNTKIAFEKHTDHYWADEMPFDRFIQNMYGSQTPAVGALEDNEIQFIQSVQPSAFNRLKNVDQVKATGAPNFPVSAIFYMNTIEPYDDVALRRAFAYATDKQDIIDIIYNGDASKSPTCVAPAAKPYYNQNAKIYEHDVTKARMVLKEAGYRWDDNGNLLQPVKMNEAGTPPV